MGWLAAVVNPAAMSLTLSKRLMSNWLGFSAFCRNEGKSEVQEVKDGFSEKGEVSTRVLDIVRAADEQLAGVQRILQGREDYRVQNQSRNSLQHAPARGIQ